MLNSVVSFSNSIGYLIHVNLEFDYSYYYNNFCRGMLREQVANKFKEDLQNALFDPAAIDPVVTKWIQEQLDCDFPLMNAIDVDEFWILYQDKRQYYNKLNRQADYENNLQEIYTRTRASSSKSTTSPRSRASSSKSTTASKSPQSLANQVGRDIYLQNVVESNSVIIFNDRSISSILKSHGKQLYEVYDSLSAEEQSLCGFCFNGILNHVNQKECGQKKLFTNDQWDYLLKHLGPKKMKHLPKLSDATKNEVENIIKEIKSGQEEEA
ncbi:hypothetical protein MFLAVUS_010411 [Mucor flavus]|uniref:Uncharacterized protein n=1 Tax=Mucor flavus TaxID=439312 RepID=A0ABP9ZCP4_9FUNG